MLPCILPVQADIYIYIYIWYSAIPMRLKHDFFFFFEPQINSLELFIVYSFFFFLLIRIVYS